ncbi:rho guanine nucleotide exchange factor 7 isoform X2 [Oncorhynchus tshawytscha]|uniref:rho guanine nucleotide exchange factor 7 isoform X2 n=1 Tax=Oncorhynchus tshawytscha TaxID=74940 RepID=UPI001C3E24B3|nr:rho guanine nucleotide exchange factor 7 isoform X2 [Oncorhynchus tshawytscha]
MNSAEHTVTWLITLGVLESPKKTISDPEGFLQSSLKDGVVLCKLVERLRPGSVEKIFQEPRNDSEFQSNIKEFLKGCGSFRVEPFEVNDLLQGLNFTKVLNSLVALAKATEDIGVGSDSVCAHHSSSLRIKSFDSLNTQSPRGRSSKLLHNQYRSLDMSESGGQRVLVRAKFTFQQTNEDELSFNKGDMISVSRQEDGGWWEGSFNGNKGWFPSNYVKEVKGSDKPVSPKSATLKNPVKGFDTPAVSKTYYNLVLQNILETETEYSKELQSLLTSYLHSLQPTDKLSSADVSHILGNLEDISTFQLMLVQSYEECTRLPESQQRVGGFFLNLLPEMKALYMAYCSNHPSAVNVLTEHSEELGEFMEGKGASSPGILTLTTGLSKPFMRLDKYPTLLKELERHMEEHHADRPDIQKCLTSFKGLSAQCQEVRKRKELELQILTETIRRWEGDDIRTLGPVLYMSHTLCHTHGSEVRRLSKIYTQERLNSVCLSSLGEARTLPPAVPKCSPTAVCQLQNEWIHLPGSTCERMQVVCNNQQDLQEWVEHLSRHTQIRNAPSVIMTTPTAKPQSVPCHTLPSHPLTPTRHSESRGVSGGPAYHTLPHPSSHGAPQTPPMWGPLEPPSTPKPWSLSCLRPAPPLKPSAALCYKEDLSKSPKSMKKLLPKRKPERKASDEDFATRKSTAALEEDAQILKVIEAYCTSAKTRQTLNSTWQGTDLMHNHVLAEPVDRSSVDTIGCRSSLSRGTEPWSDLSEDSDYDSIWTASSYRTSSVSRSREKSGVHMLFPEEEKIIVEETKSNGQTVIEEKTLVDTVYGLKDEVQELKQDNKKMRRTLDEEQKARKELEKILRRVLKNMNDPTWDETNL